jgi:iron(III) transport system permease protein
MSAPLRPAPLPPPTTPPPPPLEEARPRRGPLRLTGRTWFIISTSVVLMYLILGPLGVLLFSSFKRTDGTLPFEAASPWTMENYRDVFLSAGTYSVLWNTLVFSVGSLVLSFAISIALSWLVERTDLPLRTTVFTLVIASLGIPGVISGIAWTLLLSPRNGVVNIWLRTLFGLSGEGPLNAFTMWGLIGVQAITLVPVTFLLITAAFRAMSAVLEEAGVIAGARFGTVVRRITLPVLAPGLVSALIYQAVTVVESFDIPLIIGLRAGIPVLSTRIFLAVRPPGGLTDFGLASTYSILLLAISVGPLLYYNYIIARSERFTTVTGKDYRQRRYELGRAKPFALAAVLGYLVISFGLPVLVLVWTSLQPYLAVPSMAALDRITFSAYEALPGNVFFTKALRNTLLLGVVTALATMVLGLCGAWVVVRTRTMWSRVMDVVAFLPHAFPGIIIGLSVLLIYLVLPVPILGTIWIIVLALVTQGVSLSTRLMGGSVAQIGMELEEAGEICGARWRQVLGRILLPLIFPAFANGLLLIFLMSIKNLTLALILYAPDSVVLSTLIFTRWDAGQTGATAAIGVVMVAITLVLSVGLRRFSAVGSVR